MIFIRPTTITDAELLSTIAPVTHMESHGHSAKAEDHEIYITKKLSVEAFRNELADPAHLYHVIFVDEVAAGYSKIILNFNHPLITEQPVTKLERIYLLKSYYGIGAGQQLFDYNVRLSMDHHQLGIWLHVWKENYRAFAFYQKQGFKIIGSYDFEVSPTHFNPNHVMYLKY
ncbi:MAG: GNAT family N-acetyltransferase [Saprospiraceae bacterium]|nr:GNAT family N-acetyltransferase [Candidatus Opimibacter iunctus]